MRVGIDISICSFNSAGNARYSRYLLHALQQVASAENLTIIPFNLPEPLRSTSAGIRRKVVVLFWELIYAPLLLPQLCRYRACMLLHTTAPMPVARLSCPLVTTILDVTPILYPQWFPSVMGWRVRRWIKRAAQRSACIITISQNTAQDLRQVLPALRTPVQPIYLGSFFEYDFEQDNRTVHLPCGNSDPYILSVGTLEPRKNLGVVLTAYQQLVRQMPDVPRLVIVGARGWMQENIRTSAEDLGIADRVMLTGFVSDAELKALYAQAMMLVYPSLYEGFGFPVLEAMSSGCPVITSNRSSLPEVAGEAGILVDPDNTQQLVAAMRLVLNDIGLAQKMRQLGQNRAELFSWQRCARETAAVYRHFLYDRN